jgi:hypothetical protein
MKKYSPLTIASTLVFLAGVVALLFGRALANHNIPGFILLAISIIYLVLGWYVFRGYYPDGHALLLFLYGYLYAGTFISFTFIVFGWPLAKTLICVAPLWALLQLLVTYAIRKKIPREGFIQFIVEGSLMLVLIIYLIIKG